MFGLDLGAKIDHCDPNPIVDSDDRTIWWLCKVCLMAITMEQLKLSMWKFVWREMINVPTTSVWNICRLNMVWNFEIMCEFVQVDIIQRNGTPSSI